MVQLTSLHVSNSCSCIVSARYISKRYADDQFINYLTSLDIKLVKFNYVNCTIIFQKPFLVKAIRACNKLKRPVTILYFTK